MSSYTKMVSRDVPRVVSVGEEINKELLNDYRGERTGWYFVGDNKYLLPSRYADEVHLYHEFPVRKDDIWISTFPRSGTTLTQELVWILVNNFDIAQARKQLLWERSPFFELSLFFHKDTKEMFLKENINKPGNRQIIEEMSTPIYEIGAAMKSPRVIKTHFALSILPKEVQQQKSKIIYVARNPKDVVISYYHLFKLWRTSDYVSSFKKFWQQFWQGLVPWGPYWSHLQEGWEHRHDDNVLFLFYEDMMKDIEKAINQIADFLGVPAPPEKVRELKEHLDIRNFCNNPVVNFENFRDIGILAKLEKSFVRKGLTREKSIEFTKEIEEEIDEWIRQNYKFTSLRFPAKN